MGNMDLMVPAPYAAEARRLLTSTGWHSTANPLDSAAALLHGLRFQDRAGHQLNLQWHALVGSSRASADDGLWARAESVAIEGTTARVLAPADQLLHVCVHGLRWSQVPAIRWVADVMAILNSAADRMDWDLLVEEARTRRVVLQMRRALDYVRVAFAVSALDRVCRQLGSLRSTIGDRIDFEVRLRPPSLGQMIVVSWFDHRRLHDDTPWFSRCLGFPGYLRSLGGLHSLMQGRAVATPKSGPMVRGRARA